MITIKEVIDKSGNYLTEKGLENSRRQAEDVIAYSLQVPRIDLYVQFDKLLNEEELVCIRQNLLRRANREPIQHIEGEVSFFNATLFVNPNVLIPRHETELLVAKIVETLKNEPLEGRVLWDIGTGSGAIAIALKKVLPSLSIIASDLSQDALDIAKKNALHNGVDIEFKLGDLFEPYEGLKADYIVSNPPYIPESEYCSLEPEVKDYEPKSSLVSGKSGLEVYARFAKDINKYLNKGAKAWFEIGYNQGKAVKELFQAAGHAKVRFEKDFSSNERFFFLELE